MAEKKCGVLPGTFGLVVQSSLFLISILALCMKRCLDKTGRTRFQFIVDSSKQIMGAGWMHVANLMVAALLGNVNGSSNTDACGWYWIQIMVDTTIGVWLEFYILHGVIWFMRNVGLLDLASDITAGIPRDGFSYIRYAKQLACWLAVVTVMKFAMVGFILVESPQLEWIASTVLSPLADIPKVKLVLVMVVTPGVMNSVQFWLVDNIFIDTTTSDILEEKGDISEEKGDISEEKGAESNDQKTDLESMPQESSIWDLTCFFGLGGDGFGGNANDNESQTNLESPLLKKQPSLNTMSRNQMVQKMQEMQIELDELKFELSVPLWKRMTGLKRKDPKLKRSRTMPAKHIG